MTGFAYAQAAPGAFDYLNSLIVPTMLIIGIMYFLMIRPQQKRLKEHQAMVANIRRGDTVVTSGGIIGKVTKVDDQELQVEIAEGVKIQDRALHRLGGARQGGERSSGKSQGRFRMTPLQRRNY
jgi:preprotein translocase subunit YajC